jgi:hypothetical protein
MWVIDYFVKANQMIREQETERLRLVSNARRQAGNGRAWRWRVEPGMGEAFEHLQDWLLPSQRDEVLVSAEAATPQQEAEPARCCRLTLCCAQAA